jgi:hypothetical protein
LCRVAPRSQFLSQQPAAQMVDDDAPSPTSPTAGETPPPLPAVAEPTPADASIDAVTATQRRLDELAVLMYTYVGVVQRDAPPASRAPEDAEEAAADDAARAALAVRAPEYARDIVRASQAVADAIARVEAEIGDDVDVVRAELAEADRVCVAVGEELKREAGEVDVMLQRVREAISVTEQDV